MSLIDPSEFKKGGKFFVLIQDEDTRDSFEQEVKDVENRRRHVYVWIQKNELFIKRFKKRGSSIYVMCPFCKKWKLSMRIKYRIQSNIVCFSCGYNERPERFYDDIVSLGYLPRY